MAVGTSLPLTGERTVPGIAEENYWFRRHEVAYEWIGEQWEHALPGAVVVDAGCGEGYGSALLASRTGRRVIGLELDRTAAAHAATHYPESLQVLSANLDAFPLADDSTDLLVSLQVIEHLWDLTGFLAECRRVLHPGAAAVLSTPNRLTFSPGLGRGEKPTNPFHVEEFDAAQLVDRMTAAGFGDIEVRGLRHGAELAGWEATNGSIVDAQVTAVLSGSDWPDDLLAAVSKVSTADFELTTDDLDSCADLIVIARSGARP